MSESGAVRVSRDFFDDAAFKDEPMSEREAFLWLIMEASFKAREKRVGNVTVTLARGQLVASSRFMAKAWKWTEPRVRRYLNRLENRRMVRCVADAGITVITLSNYDKYQSSERVGDAVKTHQPTRERRNTDANEDKGEIREVGSNEPTARERAASARDHLDPIIGSELAAAFVAHRTALKAPMTAHAGKIMAAKLAAMPDPHAAVTLSLERGWKGVFEPEPARIHPFPSKPRRQSDGSRLDDHLDALKARLAVQRLE